MRRVAKTTARRASAKSKMKSSAIGISSRKRQIKTRSKKITIYHIPRLYWQTLVLSVLLFALALMSRYFSQSVDLQPGQPDYSAQDESDYTFQIPEAPDLSEPESWTLSEEPILRGVTNVSSLVFPDGTIALYYVQDGAIYRRTSSDGVQFGEAEKTGISEDVSIPFERRPEIHNPAILQISSEYFLLVYELSPRQKLEVPQIDQPRAFYAAFSSDGLRFSQRGKIVDAARNDSGLLSGPELLLLPNGSIRLFYTSQSDRIVSMLSENNGQDWIWEGERLGRIATDPCVLYTGEGYVLYYIASGQHLSQDGGLLETTSLFRSNSADGLSFTKTTNPVFIGPELRRLQYPELLQESSGVLRLYVNILREGTNDVYDLYTAAGA